MSDQGFVKVRVTSRRLADAKRSLGTCRSMGTAGIAARLLSITMPWLTFANMCWPTFVDSEQDYT
jgi:hypothetical protein